MRYLTIRICEVDPVRSIHARVELDALGFRLHDVIRDTVPTRCHFRTVST